MLAAQPVQLPGASHQLRPLLLQFLLDSLRAGRSPKSVPSAAAPAAPKAALWPVESAPGRSPIAASSALARAVSRSAAASCASTCVIRFFRPTIRPAAATLSAAPLRGRALARSAALCACCRSRRLRVQLLSRLGAFARSSSYHGAVLLLQLRAVSRCCRSSSIDSWLARGQPLLNLLNLFAPGTPAGRARAPLRVADPPSCLRASVNSLFGRVEASAMPLCSCSRSRTVVLQRLRALPKPGSAQSRSSPFPAPAGGTSPPATCRR